MKGFRARKVSHEDAYVINNNGSKIASVKKSFENARVLAGIPKATPHSLRHTAVSWLVQKGISYAEIGSYVGMSIHMVERVYGHMSPEHLSNARESFG